MSDAIGGLFVARVQALMRAAVAEFGGQRAAARALNIPISTLRANVFGHVAQPGIQTVARIATSYVNLPPAVRHRLRGGIDLMVQLTPADAMREAMQLARNRLEWQGLTAFMNDLWHGEQRRRQERGAPPLHSFSP